MHAPAPRPDRVPGGEMERPSGQRPFASFREFYPFYLSEHADPRPSYILQDVGELGKLLARSRSRSPEAVTS